VVFLNESEFPPGTEIEGIRPHGASYYTRTAEVSTRMADGTPRSYFLKESYLCQVEIELALTAMLGISRR
jgi:hypothetical protein